MQTRYCGSKRFLTVLMSPRMTVSSLAAHTPRRLTRGAELPASAVRGHGDARTRPASVAVALPTASAPTTAPHRREGRGTETYHFPSEQRWLKPPWSLTLANVASTSPRLHFC